MTESESKTWVGTPLSDLYKGQGPWGFATPPLQPSKYHHILFETPVTLEKPPEPHHNYKPKHWDDDHVRMPYSEQSLFVVKENGEEVVKPRWDIICEALLRPINSIDELEKALNTYNNKLPKFTALHRLFSEVFEEEECDHFFKNILPGIIHLALRLPELVPGSLPLLKKNVSKSISLSQLQVASLLANAFLCTFIWRKETSGVYPSINFLRLYTADLNHKRGSCVSEKLKCIIYYFRTVINKNPVGVITFERKYLPKNQIPRWDVIDNNLGYTRVHVDSSGTIEEGLGFLQVDFANKFIGGGILGYGCVQEEIRFAICPELIVSRLFTEELTSNEAVVVTGVENFSKYSGYSTTFKWEGGANDSTPFDPYGRRRTSILVIDAMHFNKSKDQYHPSAILRELNKAYVGFSTREKSNVAPVATGNWGCGAYNGDPNLKSLIQLIACNATNRDLVYYSFGNTELRDQFYSMYMFLATNGITICQLWRYICRFCAANHSQDNLYSFIQQCHFDLKKQPTLKQFLSITTKKQKSQNDLPSTSSSQNENYNNINDKSDDFNLDHCNEDNAKVTKEVSNTTPKKIKVVKSENPPDNVNSDSLIQLIEMIDGNNGEEVQPDIEQSVPTLFSEIDKLKKITPMKVDEKNSLKDSVVIAMEVDDEEEQKPSVSFIKDKKRKISDYFSKKTNHKM